MLAVASVNFFTRLAGPVYPAVAEVNCDLLKAHSAGHSIPVSIRLLEHFELAIWPFRQRPRQSRNPIAGLNQLSRHLLLQRNLHQRFFEVL